MVDEVSHDIEPIPDPQVQFVQRSTYRNSTLFVLISFPHLYMYVSFPFYIHVFLLQVLFNMNLFVVCVLSFLVICNIHVIYR
jgi:hypothetical protein